MGQDTLFYRKNTLRIGDKIHPLSPPGIMGILNVTPDSFSDGGLFTNEEACLEQAGKMLNEGAFCIDIGGYSTRPGASDISPGEETDRVVPIIQAVKKYYPDCVVSIDTFRSDVARAAVHAGAQIVNDVSGGKLDPSMHSTVASLDVPYILMHMRGTPQSMKNETDYDDILLSIWNYFRDQADQARSAGIREIILDPGFGFAKSIDQNYYLLENLSYFHSLGLPLLVGLSRKSLIYKRLKIPPAEAVNGTTALNTVALLKGAQLLRVHDVRQAKEAIELVGYVSN